MTHENSAYHTRLLAATALVAALSCVATLVIRIPSPTGGYMNLGDTVVLLGAYLLGGGYGAAAAAIGPAMADLLSGYPVYVPATLVIKALMALLAAAIYHGFGKRRWSLILAGLAAEVLMVGGYWAYDSILMGSVAGALAGVPSNAVQSVLGIAASTILALALRGVKPLREHFPNL